MEPRKRLRDQATRRSPEEKEPASTHLVRKHPATNLLDGEAADWLLRMSPAEEESRGQDTWGLGGPAGHKRVEDLWGQVCRGAWQGGDRHSSKRKDSDIHSWCQAVPSVSSLALAPG